MTGCTHIWRESCHADYDQCEKCCSYRSRVAVRPEAFYTPDYWSHERGHSTMQEQVYNVEMHRENGVCKNDFVINLLRSVEDLDKSIMMEIGCAPGVLMRRLMDEEKFGVCYGVEACAEWRQEIWHIARHHFPILAGLFPSATRFILDERLTCLIALDVFEHSHEPEAFLAECWRLLRPNGTLLLMMPMAAPGLPERFFCAQEHAFLHSQANLGSLLADAGFRDLSFDAWTRGHETVIARRI